VDKTLNYTKKIVQSVDVLQQKSDDLNNFAKEQEVMIEDMSHHSDMLIMDMTEEVTMDIEEIAEETCRADYTNKATPCCPDCHKAEYRTPDSLECQKTGCQHSCAYLNATCDASKQILPTPCLFPFKSHGHKFTACTKTSPFGEVERPWCVLDTAKNRKAGHKDASELEIGFCDCTKLTCVCPPGETLDKDGKKCLSKSS